MLHLKKFDPSTVSDGSVIVIIGRRGTGKSVLLRSIMRAKSHIPAGIVCAGTESGNRAYGGPGGPMPSEFVYDAFNQKAVERLIARQKKLAPKNMQGLPPPAFLILDDCMYDKKFMNTETMRFLFFNGRHFNIFFVITAQYCMDLPPFARQNIDWFVTLRNAVRNDRKKLYEFFGGTADLSFDEFGNLLDQATKNHEALVINGSGDGDQFYFYRGDFPMPKFKMGSQGFWEAAARVRARRRETVRRHAQAVQAARAPLYDHRTAAFQRTIRIDGRHRL